MTSTDTERTIDFAGRRDQVRALTQHADAKGQSLLGVHSMAVAGAVALAKLQSTPSPLLYGAAAVTALALITTLCTIMPRLGRRLGAGFTAWAAMTPPQLLTALQDGRDDDEQALAAEIVKIARIARRKFRLLQTATWLLIAGVILAMAGLVVS